MSWPSGGQAHDVVGRLSDNEDTDEGSDEMELTFVPASKRHKAPHAASSTGPSATTALTSSTATAAVAEPSVKARTETVYEQERNAKVRQLLAEQHKARPGVLFSLDTFESAMPDPGSLAGFAELLDGAPGATRGYRGGRGGGGPRRYRMPNPNMSEEEQARYIRHRRNMAVTRNALREVDPETLEYMQVTQAADQAPTPWRGRDGPSASYGGSGGSGSGPSRGRGGFGGGPYRGRGGRGGGGDGGYGFSLFDSGRGRSYGGGGGGAGRGGRGGGGGGAFSPF